MSLVSLIIDKFKKILKKLLRLIDLIRTQVFYIHKPKKFIKIDKNKEFMLAALKKMAPDLKNVNSN